MPDEERDDVFKKLNAIFVRAAMSNLSQNLRSDTLTHRSTERLQYFHGGGFCVRRSGTFCARKQDLIHPVPSLLVLKFSAILVLAALLVHDLVPYI